MQSIAIRCVQLFLHISVLFSIGVAHSSEATTNEEFAINLWTHTCAVADSLEKLEATIRNFGVERSKTDEGTAWRYNSTEFGPVSFRWTDAGSCEVAIIEANSENARAYFDKTVQDSVPGNWQSNRVHKKLESGIEIVSHLITTEAGRRIEFAIMTSPNGGQGTLVIRAIYQQPSEDRVDDQP